ncbi:MAG TPA: transposase [Anaeromyxobacteraceae bacterium]|nr:transposase [Anaeromyxobacteraceae bacterium]
MDRESKPKKPRWVRWSFTEEFKVSAVRLVLDQGKSVSAAARDLDLPASALQG